MRMGDGCFARAELSLLLIAASSALLLPRALALTEAADGTRAPDCFPLLAGSGRVIPYLVSVARAG